MEINTVSLFLGILLACSLPLLLAAMIIFPILASRLRLRETARLRQNLKQGTYDEFFANNKSRLILRIIGVCMLLFITSLFMGFLILVYGYGNAAGFGNWIYWVAIAIPLLCSILVGAFLLIFRYKRTSKK